MNDNLKAIKQLLSERLCEKRYRHSLNVADEARRLAEIFGEDPEKAYFAGLVHDICKDEPKEEQLQRIRNSAIIWDDNLLKQPPVWHGFAGAEYIRQVLGIEDEEIIPARAIVW